MAIVDVRLELQLVLGYIMLNLLVYLELSLILGSDNFTLMVKLLVNSDIFIENERFGGDKLLKALYFSLEILCLLGFKLNLLLSHLNVFFAPFQLLLHSTRLAKFLLDF